MGSSCFLSSFLLSFPPPVLLSFCDIARTDMWRLAGCSLEVLSLCILPAKAAKWQPRWVSVTSPAAVGCTPAGRQSSVWCQQVPARLPSPPCCPADKGHQALAELLAQTLRAAARNVAAAAPRSSLLATLATVSVDTDGGGGSSSTRRVGQQFAAVSVLPPPMIPGNADAETTLCAMQVMGSADTCHAGQPETKGIIRSVHYDCTLGCTVENAFQNVHTSLWLPAGGLPGRGGRRPRL